VNNSPHPSLSLLERVPVRSHTTYVRQEGVLLGVYIYMLTVGVSSRASLGFTCNAACGCLSVRSRAHAGHILAEGGVLPGAYTCSPLEGVLSRVHVGMVGRSIDLP
jgi:hypothetical protein